MPGLLQRSIQFGNAPPPVCSPCPAAGSLISSGIWSKQRDDIAFDQLQKFWSELPLQARQELLRIDKQTLFEQARKNLYCSRCNGLLLEGFSQIVMYGKSLQQEGVGMYLPNRTGAASKTHINCELDDVQDPSVHPWGGLATTRDGILTLLECFLNAKSLKALQNVFDSARARERERELLYPDACGGGGRGWISQGMANYGRGHGTRETCALHTARLSCDTLVDFWSALGEETRSSLLRMKEEDFIERLMYRFDSKRFCRDCRRNVIREFKELKELKRMRRELRCTSWFCVADTAFQYEVSENTVQADWQLSFTDTVGTYHHFEWAIGTGEGKSDIVEFEDVGMSGKAQASGLELSALTACFITLRAWKLDGRCTELCVKAYALKGQPCVHRRLVVGDGFVMITKGESIRRFFEHAEEAEEEEDDDAMDKDGNELDGDGARPQKHAKSPELAREFLLDAATVIFKEQVEKAFREGTARQNAHSIFVSLALKLLEERVHVACKEIITLEKQIKLLEEEEKEKREEEESRERRRNKEREKKLRRKERLKGKERERERKHHESSANDLSTSTHDESSPTALDSGDSVSDLGETITLPRPLSPDIKDEKCSNGYVETKDLNSNSLQHQCHVDGEFSVRDGNGSFIIEQSKSSRRKLRFKNDSFQDQASKWYDKHRCVTSERAVKTNARNYNLKFVDKFHGSNSRLRDRYDFQSCSCNHDYGQNDGYQISTIRSGREIKSANRTEVTLDMPRPLYRSSKGKLVSGPLSRDVLHVKQVWEPRSNSDLEITSRSAAMTNQLEEIGFDKKVDDHCSSEISGSSGKADAWSSYKSQEGIRKCLNKSENGIEQEFKSDSCDPILSSSSSDNCSSCLSEGDSSISSSSSAQNAESSSTSDSEDASPQSEGRDTTSCNGSAFDANGGLSFTGTSTGFQVPGCMGADFPREESTNSGQKPDGARFGVDVGPSQQHQQQHILPIHNHGVPMPLFTSPTMGYHHNGSAVSWSAASVNGSVPFPQHNPYVLCPTPSRLGFGLPANQYNTLQPMSTPVFNLSHQSMPQAPNRVFVASSKDHQIKNFSFHGPEPMGNVHVHPLERPCPNRPLPSQASSPGQNGSFRNNAAKSPYDSPSFSLFHFGGPMAARLVSRSPEAGVDITNSKEDMAVEEYSLFAAGNGARFSFF